jgi:hypothetical protein
MANVYFGGPVEYYCDFEMKPGEDHRWIFPEHPLHYGFERGLIADPKEGKVSDWILSLPGQGRLHAQVFAGGTIRFHWDRKDPAQQEALEHVLEESKFGPWIKAAGMAVGVVALVKVLDELTA